MPRRRRRAEREQGQALVLFALSLVVILAFAGLVVDLGVLRNNRQILVNSIDAAALAGGTMLPLAGAAAETAADNLIDGIITVDYSGLPLPTTTNGGITYRCLVGVNSSGQADLTQTTEGMCNPSASLGTLTEADFTGSGSSRSSTCNPAVGDTCNVVVVSASATTNYGFAPVVGIRSGSTGTIMSAACNGPCGVGSQTPTDLVLIIDRTDSMTTGNCAVSTGLNCVLMARQAADAVLQVYNPAYERVAFGTIGPSSTSSSSPAQGTGLTACVNTTTPTWNVHTAALTSSTGYGTTIPSNYPASPGNVPNWLPVRLSGTDGSAPIYDAYSSGTAQPYTLALPSASHLVDAINCFDSPGGTGTNLATPLLMAQAELNADTRSGVIKGILLETDGQPNYGVGSDTTDYTCAGDIADATIVKNAGIQIYTVGFGLDNEQPSGPNHDAACPDTSSMDATGNLAAMASNMTSGSPSPDLGCPSPSNILTAYPGDHAFCEVKSTDGGALLQTVFKYIAVTLAKGGLHLLNLYPQPIVTSLSTATGSLTQSTNVTITGEFFTGATSVTGATSFANSATMPDTTINAVMPAGTAAGTVNIQVTTPGGTSPIVSADQFTYP